MNETLPPAHSIRRAPLGQAAHDLVTLNYHERMIRRKRLITAHDESFVVDLAETVSLDHGDAFALTDGRLVQVVAAPEALMQVTGDLPRLAWHIGNRHAPCQIGADALILQRDKVLRGMLEGLGAVVTDMTAPFTPDGGAYGHGRTLGHSHD
jgi:urease accessory protein